MNTENENKIEKLINSTENNKESEIPNSGNYFIEL